LLSALISNESVIGILSKECKNHHQPTALRKSGRLIPVESADLSPLSPTLQLALPRDRPGCGAMLTAARLQGRPNKGLFEKTVGERKLSPLTDRLRRQRAIQAKKIAAEMTSAYR
jgi:hypothetical protein